MADPAGAPTAAAANPDDRSMGLLIHILGIFTGFLGPLIVWLIKKDSSPFIDQTGRKCLNFHFSTLVYGFGLILLAITIILIPVTVLGLIALGALRIAFGVIGCLRANEGKVYDYPLAIKFLK